MKTKYYLTQDIILQAGTELQEAPNKVQRATEFGSLLIGHGPNTTSEWVVPLDEAIALNIVSTNPQTETNLAERIADSLISFVDAYYWPEGEQQLTEHIQKIIDGKIED